MGFAFTRIRRDRSCRNGNPQGIIFFWEVFLSGRDSGLVSWRLTCYWLVWLFSISVFSPVVKRGKLCSGNRGLRFGIRADNKRFLTTSFLRRPLVPRKMLETYPPFFVREFSVRHRF